MTLNKFSAFLLPLLVVAACVGPEPLPPAPTTGDMTLEQLMASDEQAMPNGGICWSMRQAARFWHHGTPTRVSHRHPRPNCRP
jgi:hypothetical protein